MWDRANNDLYYSVCLYIKPSIAFNICIMLRLCNDFEYKHRNNLIKKLYVISMHCFLFQSSEPCSVNK